MFKLFYPKFWCRKSFLSYLLWLPSNCYYLATIIRNISVVPVRIARAKVICVGNATIGGTGKTQVALWLAEFFKKQNISCVIVTRPYKAKLKNAMIVSSDTEPALAGDESVMLARNATVISTYKLEQAIPIIESLSPAVVILDDGLQNPSFIKDFTILVIDGVRKFGNNFLLPAGPLRESPTNALKKANIAIIVGSDKDPLNKSYLNNVRPEQQILHGSLISRKQYDRSKNYFAFSGIGNPERFIQTLEFAKVSLVGSKIFPDHHIYTKKDCDYLLEKSKILKAELITTSKDYVKICSQLEVEEFAVRLAISDQAILENLLYELISEKN